MDMGHEKIWLGGRRASRTPYAACYFLFLAPARGEKAKLGGELRHEERLISRTGMCKDRVGTIDDLSEGGFHLRFPPTLARPESHRSRGQPGPTRPAPADRPSRSASPQRLEQAALRGDQRHFIFHNVSEKNYV
jgi:hypothetical protein